MSIIYIIDDKAVIYMKFLKDKKVAIRQFILEKISQGDLSLAKTVAENFEIKQNTVYSYINELVDENVICRVRRGEYALVSTTYEYHLQRSKGDMENDTGAYKKYVAPLIKDYTQSIKDIWQYAFSEMFNNVMDHSGAENARLIIAQTYLETTICLIDDGVGIFEKIRSFFDFEDLDEAISELFKGKLTTDSKNHSGEGIFFSSKAMDFFAIISSGKVFTCNKYDISSIEDEALNPEIGTCVKMSLSNFSHKNIKEVFDQYADTEYGFTKTKVPLKNIFDTAPVSRSQAKRVSSRLDEFKEAEIDFAEVEWMGQGFAHQLFVVFQREHPGLKLTPINMNSSVENMYKHVLNSL